eukprot:scaffold3354_cov369-Prasinococcus_capsulatus_cf.AAC.7
MRAKALAEAEGRIKEGRENRDIQLEQLRVKGEQELRKALEVPIPCLVPVLARACPDRRWLSGSGLLSRELG